MNKLIFKRLLKICKFKQSGTPDIKPVLYPVLYKKYRLALNLTIQEVSNKTGVSKATISRIERGKDTLFSNIIKLNNFYIKHF